MPGEYAGHLRSDDPLHAYLSHHVLPNMGVTARPVDFRVFCLKQTKVYRYEESHSRAQVVGKFFVNGSHHGPVAMDACGGSSKTCRSCAGTGWPAIRTMWCGR
jgi:hypothetical protein